MTEPTPDPIPPRRRGAVGRSSSHRGGRHPATVRAHPAGGRDPAPDGRRPRRGAAASEQPTSYDAAGAPLDRTTAVCPPQLGGAADVRFGNTGLGSGDLTLRVGRDDDTEALVGRRVREERSYVVVGGSGELAPGLVVSRSGGGAATGRDQPAPERWFTGLGASAEHSSTLTLVNPDKGPAVADVSVWDGSGLVDAPALRGVRIPGGGSTSFDLSDVTPNRDALAAQVLVSRGRLAASVVDTIDPLGRDRPVREWLPGQDAPATTSYVVGVGSTRADRVLTLANPGDSEQRVAIKLVSGDSEFAPSGLEEVTLAPASVTEVDLSGVLRGRTLAGVHALRLDATGPVTASLRSRTATDLAVATAGPAVTSETAAALPAGTKKLVVAGATAPGVLVLRAWDADGGEVVRERRVEVDAGTATRVNLPDDAVLALVRLERTGAVVSLEVDDGGVSLLPLAQLGTTSRVPDVRPAQR